MLSRVKKVLLFTVTACPMGRSMNTVMKEVCNALPQLCYEVVYADLQPDITNRYRVSKNPTMILSGIDEELFRIEEFTETDDMISIIQQTEAGKLATEKRDETSGGSIEEYVVYLLKDGELTPVRVTYENKTSVKSPRITAIKCLLKGEEGYVTPFPPASELLQVQFDGKVGEVFVRVTLPELQIDQEMMKEALLHTLSPYGVQQVGLHLV